MIVRPWRGAAVAALALSAAICAVDPGRGFELLTEGEMEAVRGGCALQDCVAGMPDICEKDQSCQPDKTKWVRYLVRQCISSSVQSPDCPGDLTCLCAEKFQYTDVNCVEGGEPTGGAVYIGLQCSGWHCEE